MSDHEQPGEGMSDAHGGIAPAQDGPARPVLAASIAVFRDGRVLLARRGKAPAFGLYSLPGGRVERGESLKDAALRELMEEVGLSAEIAGFIDHVEHIENDANGGVQIHAVIAAYAGWWRAGEAHVSDEASALLWVDPLAPGAQPMTKGLPDILRKAARLIATPSGRGAR